MNEKTKTPKEQEDNMDIGDGLYTGEESLESKSPKTPPQQPGDTPSVVKEDWGTKERNKIEKNRISAITGLITMAVAVIILSVLSTMVILDCSNKEMCMSPIIIWLAEIPLLVLFLAGFITAIVNAIIYFAHKNKNKILYEQQGNTENNIKQKTKSSKSLVITLWVLGIILGIIGIAAIIFGLSGFAGSASFVFYIFAAIVIALSVPFFAVAANETKRK